jgi:hypothetical protein
MKKQKWWSLALLAGTLVITVHARAQNGGSGQTIMLSCNIDGTYTCGGHCMKSPWNGRGCCRIPNTF